MAENVGSEVKGKSFKHAMFIFIRTLQNRTNQNLKLILTNEWKKKETKAYTHFHELWTMKK